MRSGQNNKKKNQSHLGHNWFFYCPLPRNPALKLQLIFFTGLKSLCGLRFGWRIVSPLRCSAELSLTRYTAVSGTREYTHTLRTIKQASPADKVIVKYIVTTKLKEIILISFMMEQKRLLPLCHRSQFFSWEWRSVTYCIAVNDARWNNFVFNLCSIENLWIEEFF